MRWLALLLCLGLLTGMTSGAYLASVNGWGLAGLLNTPVSVREESAAGQRHGPSFFYFSSGRRHFGGGFHGGK
jgi:hypothetical protein